MKRALAVSVTTLAGVVAVLSYSSPEAGVLVASDVPDGTSTGLGAPEVSPSVGPSTSPSDEPDFGSPSPSSSAPVPSTTTSASTSPKPTRSASASPSPSPTPSTSSTKPKPKPKPKPTKKPSASPSPSPSGSSTPSPSPSPTGPVTYTGTTTYHRYGPVKVAITVEGGRITDVWAVDYPTGESQDISDRAIPILRAETLEAQSASIASVTGATLTWSAWKRSLLSAMAKAGL